MWKVSIQSDGSCDTSTDLRASAEALDSMARQAQDGQGTHGLQARSQRRRIDTSPAAHRGKKREVRALQSQILSAVARARQSICWLSR